MKYKVGDKVRIKEGLVVNESYGENVVTRDMGKRLGSFCKIKEVLGGGYKLDVKSALDWTWTDEMLDPAEEQKKVFVFPEWAKWIARDADGALWVYENEPYRNIIHSTWEAETGDAKRVPENAYTISEISWEDKPMPINLYAHAFTAIDPDDMPDDVIESLVSAAFEQPDDSNRSIYTPVTETVDNVNHPQHYKHGEIETLDIIRMSLTPEEFQGFLKGNVLKYQLRAPFKHETPDEDYKKAKYYYDEYREVSE